MPFYDWKPLRKALAWVVTRDKVFADERRFDGSVVIAGCLHEAMKSEGCFGASADRHAALCLETVPKGYGGRFQRLAKEFEAERLREPAREDEEEPEGGSERLKHPTGKLNALRYLRWRIDRAVSEIGHLIAAGKLRATGILVDRDREHPAGEIPPSAITETMRLSHDGHLLQDPSCKGAPYWKSVMVDCRDLLKLFPADGRAPNAMHTVGDESACRNWLVSVIDASPDMRAHTNEQLWQQARAQFPNLSKRGFDRAKATAIERTGCDAWREAGAPTKSGTRGPKSQH